MTNLYVTQGPDEGLWMALAHFRTLETAGGIINSRNGPILEICEPVLTTFANPAQRVSFDPIRDANPFFHLFESIWMLAGRNDVEFPAHFAGNIRNYAEDDGCLHGAYGHRWRQHFGRDQLDWVIEELKSNPESRRVVLTMWDPHVDVPNWAKDHPCNTQCLFRMRQGKLTMTVCNRSNDAVWGLFGANVVHFSILMEYVASSVGVGMGPMYFMSNSLHLYPEVPVADRLMNQMYSIPEDVYDPLSTTGAYSLGLLSGREEPYMIDGDILELMNLPIGRAIPVEVEFDTIFFRHIVRRMWNAHCLYKSGQPEEALNYLQNDQPMCHVDWIKAGAGWLRRRIMQQAKNDAQKPEEV